jgi:hypothetical protein
MSTWPFPYGHSVSPGHLGGVGDVQISPLFFLALTVCPYDDGCKTVVDLDTCLIPLRLESSSSVEFGSRKPPLENPLTHTTNSLPAPFARPPEVARRGLFLSAIFRAPRKGTSEAKADRDARRWPRGRGPARTVVDRVSRRRRGDSVGRMARAEALHLPL